MEIKNYWLIGLLELFAFTWAIEVPPGFKFGVATASYQIEGGWNASGKGENIWDRLTHTHPELIADHSTGDIACDSYHLWKTDIAILKSLKVHYYRFSLSWTRILPNGFSNKINPDGINYYNNLINSLLANNIEPMVTLYHWDLPQPIQDLGGWTNPQIALYLEDFARVAFVHFGDRVKKWITINEPASICEDTYGNGDGAPDVKSPGIGDYLCGKTILLAHARIYRLYDKYFRSSQKGKIGITIDSIWAEPRTAAKEDVEAAEREMQMGLGWWSHPIYSKSGDYPPIMKQRIASISKAENFSESRLPSLTDEEVKLIQGTADFFGLNHYHTWLISHHEYPITDPPSFRKDKGTIGTQDPNWKPSPKIVPWGLRKLLNWIKMEYDNPLVYITENGYPDEGNLNDADRVLFMKLYIKAVLDAVLKDGCNVKCYTAWSVLDNMEWRSGYTVKFGLYHVDFNSPNRTRTEKMSAKFYRNLIQKGEQIGRAHV